VFIAWKTAGARRHVAFWHPQQTQQRPQPIARFRRTRWKASVLGCLPDTDGLVGAPQLDICECVYWDDAVALFDVLSQHIQTTQYLTQCSACMHYMLTTQVCTGYSMHHTIRISRNTPYLQKKKRQYSIHTLHNFN